MALTSLPTRDRPGNLPRPTFEWVDVTMPAQGEDVTALLQAEKRRLKSNQALRLPAGRWRLSNILHTDEPDTGFVGAVGPTGDVGTKLDFTNIDKASYQVHGQGIGKDKGAHRHWIEGVHFEGLGWDKLTEKDRTGLNEAGHSPICLRNGVRDVCVQDVVTEGARGAGFFNYMTSGTRVNRLKVRRTLADSIHNNKWTNAIYTDCETSDGGDDSMAGVTYNWDSLDTQGVGLKVYRFKSWGNAHGRGLAFINSRQLDAYDISVQDTGAAGLILARETRKDGTTLDGLTDVSVEKMVIDRANHRLYDDHGAVALINGNDGEFARVRLNNFDIIDTNQNRPWPTLQKLVKTGPNYAGQTVRQIGYGQPQGKFTDVVMTDFRFWGDGPKTDFGGNITGGAGVTRTGWRKMNGQYVPQGPATPVEPKPGEVYAEVVTIRVRDSRGNLSAPVQVRVAYPV
jgi:hypothetical protein